MSWSNHDGTHEGYVRAEFADGQRELGVITASVPDGEVAVSESWVTDDQGRPIERYETRPAAEVIGWRIMCNCRPIDSSTVQETWTSATLLTRVATTERHAPPAGRLYVVDNDVQYVDDLFHETVVARWKLEHAGRADALAAVRSARRDELSASEALGAAVAAARRSGHSWEAIGAACSMSRQAAHQRWSR